MTYLLTQMWLYMLGAGLLGLIFGWIIWGRSKHRLFELGQALSSAETDRDRYKSELETCNRTCSAQKLQLDRFSVRSSAFSGSADLPAAKDDLRRLIGIGPINEGLLNKAGITTFAQIASWSPADIAEVEHMLQFGGRVEREQWVTQAGLLASGDEEEFLRRFPTAASDTNT
jgi:predicted flap endonuclease-1-like 5' DNA nuclease